jgi:hypothetical protein
MKKTLSGLQKEVIGLYRTIIREALKKDKVAASTAGRSDNTVNRRLPGLWKDPQTSSFFAKEEFRKQVESVKRTDFRTIEHKLRHGHKQVKLLRMPGVKVVGRAVN